MNKKVLGLFFAFIFSAVLAAPMVGTVIAGKGQEKLDFLLHMEGSNAPPPDKMWVTPNEVTMHVRGGNWVVREDFYIQIGPGGAVETITKECLSYEASLHNNINIKEEFFCISVRETITIYTDETQMTERGTIEILTNGVNRGENGAVVVGFGTGEFEGIKISGKTITSTMVNPSPPPDNLLVLDRVGTVMGWP